MEAGTVVAGPTPNPSQYMPALAKAQRRRQEVAQLKRDLAAGRVTAAQALVDPRSTGSVTLGTILIAQPGWGRRKTGRFLQRLGAPSAAFTKRVEDMVPRQKAIIILALRTPSNQLGIAVAW